MLVACAVMMVLPGGAAGEQASQPGSPAAAGLDAGLAHTCALGSAGGLRCWGYGSSGELGYGDTQSVGDDETPASVGPVSVGSGHTAVAVSAGDYFTCALLDDGSVRCWGYGGNGELGYGNTNDVASPAAAGPVDLGGHTARAISAGGAHACAVLDDGDVRCWGFGANGELGYGNQSNVGDQGTPGSVRPVHLGTGRTAVAISAGARHTCAILDDGNVRCWGYSADGRLGYGNLYVVGWTSDTTPDMFGPVKLGAGRTAIAISAGSAQTCVILNGGDVRCWGYGGNGELGYGDMSDIGATPDTTPDTAGPVSLGVGRSAVAISAGPNHTCAVLDDHSVRCWGYGGNGRLGYGSTANVGDTPATTPDRMSAVNLGVGRGAVAISAGQDHTCARLDDGHVRCWGFGANGRLGYCSESDVGDSQLPGSVGPVNLETGDGGATCPGAATSSASVIPSVASGTVPGAAPVATGPITLVGSDTARARGLRDCLANVRRDAKRATRLARNGSAIQRVRARRNLRRHQATERWRCLQRYGRIPGPIGGLRALAFGNATIELDFSAAGTNQNHPPPAYAYLIKQSRHPIRTTRDFLRAQALCQGSCVFPVTKIGDIISLLVTNLRPRTTYYYAIAARDNVTDRCGPRSRTVHAKTTNLPFHEPPPSGMHDHTPVRLLDHRIRPCRTVAATASWVMAAPRTRATPRPARRTGWVR